MPEMNGIEATRKIKEVQPDIKIIGLSLNEADDMARPMIEAGQALTTVKPALLTISSVLFVMFTTPKPKTDYKFNFFPYR